MPECQIYLVAIELFHPCPGVVSDLSEVDLIVRRVEIHPAIAELLSDGLSNPTHAAMGRKLGHFIQHFDPERLEILDQVKVFIGKYPRGISHSIFEEEDKFTFPVQAIVLDVHGDLAILVPEYFFADDPTRYISVGPFMLRLPVACVEPFMGELLYLDGIFSRGYDFVGSRAMIGFHEKLKIPVGMGDVFAGLADMVHRNQDLFCLLFPQFITKVVSDFDLVGCDHQEWIPIGNHLMDHPLVVGLRVLEIQ